MKPDLITYNFVDTPIGRLVTGCTSSGCCLIEFEDRGGLQKILSKTEKRYGLPSVESDHVLLETLSNQIRKYFSGESSRFELPLHIEGTEFEKQVWELLLAIPPGETTSYGEIAQQLGNSGASRAVGAANGRNSIAIVVPCHRVIQKDGGLRGYGGGLWRKQFLLRHEASMGLAPQATLDF